MVAEPGDYRDLNGTLQPAAAMDLRARLLFLGKCHESMAGTGSVCTTAASRVPGSVVRGVLPAGSLSTNALRIGHPLGVMTLRVDVEDQASRRRAGVQGASASAARHVG